MMTYLLCNRVLTTGPNLIMKQEEQNEEQEEQNEEREQHNEEHNDEEIEEQEGRMRSR